VKERLSSRLDKTIKKWKTRNVSQSKAMVPLANVKYALAAFGDKRYTFIVS